MDHQVIMYYRRLLREGFAHAGSIENPAIMLDTVGEKIRICGHTSYNYMHIYFAIAEERITDIKYTCTCDPTANVVVETMCGLLSGKDLSTAEKIGVDDFVREIGSTGDDFLKKSQGMVELVRRGIQRYWAQLSAGAG
jgi:NifU-like protein involved in Fe-S cluster formation